MEQIPNCVLVSSKRRFMFSFEDGDEEIPYEQKHALMTLTLLKSGKIDSKGRDHVFLSPNTNECISIQGEVIKRFRSLRVSTDAEWFVCFDDSYDPCQVALAKTNDNTDENQWKMSANSLNASMSPLEIYQDEACSVDSQAFEVEDRDAYVIDNRK